MNIIRFFYLRVIFSFKKHKKRHESNMTHVPVLISFEYNKIFMILYII